MTLISILEIFQILLILAVCKSAVKWLPGGAQGRSLKINILFWMEIIKTYIFIIGGCALTNPLSVLRSPGSWRVILKMALQESSLCTPAWQAGP